MSLGKKTLRELREFVDAVGNGDVDSYIRDADRHLAAIDRALSVPRGVKLARKRAVAKKEERGVLWRGVRKHVMRRASGSCECCGKLADTLTPDHIFGGSGRRKSLEAAFTVWAICFDCDQRRTANEPSREWWLRRFARHAMDVACRESLFGRSKEAAEYTAAANRAERDASALAIQAQLAQPKGAV